jgi:hypothetical protein
MSHDLERRVSALEKIHVEEPRLVVSFDPCASEEVSGPSWLDSVLVRLEGADNSFIVRPLGNSHARSAEQSQTA